MSKSVIVIPIYKFYPSRSEIKSLVQCCKILGGHEFTFVCPKDFDVNIYNKILLEHNINFKVIEFDKEYFGGVAGYNKLMLSSEFYEKFKDYDFMLIYQLDAYVFRDELQEWCEKGYDYIGAPWFEGYGLADNKSELIEYSGNGGFSLRNISSFLKVLNFGDKSERLIKEFIRTGNNEDGFFSFHANKIVGNFSVAPTSVAMHFSFECLPEKLYALTDKKLPFGCHAWEKYNLNFWSSFMDINNAHSENKMKFSIIICTYNVAKKLPKTLDSIFTQTCDDYEVVIIDGASNDGTIGIIKEYENKFNGKLNWISEKDSGIYEAMNKGVRIAKGEFLNVVGAGDWLEKDALENAIKCIIKNDNVDAVHGKLRIWDKSLTNSYLLQTTPDVLVGNPMQHPALYYKKELHKKYGLYDESYGIVSDYLFCMKAFLIGNAKIVKFGNVVDNYVTDGISSTNIEQCYNESMLIRQELNLNPLVSIIVPAYNQGKYIEETIESILAQKYLNWECVIVNDGSTDDTDIVVKNIINDDKRFRYVKQENQGLSITRNNGILKSNGEFILPLDADDLISPFYVRDAVSVFLRDTDTRVVYCEAEYFGARTGKWKLPDYSYEKMLFHNMIFCSAMYRREDYNKTNGYNKNMKFGLEDWDFWVSLLEQKDVVFRIPKTYFYYRIKDKSMNIDLYKNDRAIELMYKQIYLNHKDKYEEIINPIYTQNRLNELLNHINKNKGVSILERVLFFGCDVISGISFALSHPKKFTQKYFDKLLNSGFRQPIRKIWYAIRFKKLP